MDKRLFIAVLLSVAFLALWALLVPMLFPDLVKKPPVTRPQAGAPSATTPSATTSTATTPGATPAPRPAGAAAVVAPAVPIAPVAASAAIETVIDNPEFTARLSNRGAQLLSFKLKKYQEKDGTLVELVHPRTSDRLDFPFAVAATSKETTHLLNRSFYAVDDRMVGNRRLITYRFSNGRISMTKEFAFTNEYQFGFAAQLTGGEAYRIQIGPGLKPLRPGDEEGQFLVTGNGIVQEGTSVEVLTREDASGLDVFPAPGFIGLEENYFMAALQPQVGGDGVFRVVKIPPVGKEKEPRKELYAGVNAVNGAVKGKAFFGPKDAAILDRYGLSKTLHFGYFGPIARFLLKALIWIHTFTSNYGWAIIVLTIIIKILLYPLQHKSIVSMKKMQKVQPKVTALRERYKKAKTDPEQRQKMNTEMMKLYQQEGINPMSGCFPILLQLPILWAFYSLLSQAIELRGADFMGWINDLSVKDPYYLTPILMMITMLVQQHITPSTADPAQKKMFMIMALAFGFVFKDFPSGLVLYWLVQNLLTIIQQLIMNKFWKDHPPTGTA